MDETGLLDAELDRAGLRVLDGLCHVWRDRTDFRVRHQAAGPEHLTETTDNGHHVWRCDDAVEVHEAALDFFHQVFGADEIGSGFLGFVSLGILCEHGDANVLAGARRKIDHTTDHLVCIFRVNAEVHGDLDGFVEFRFRVRLHQRDSFGDRVGLVGIHGFRDCAGTLSWFRHDAYSVTSMPIARADPAMIFEAASRSFAFRSSIFISAISRT